MIEAYEYKRNHDGLNISPAEDFVKSNSDIIKVDYGKIPYETAKGYNDTILELIDEYDTCLQKIVPMGKEDAFF